MNPVAKDQPVPPVFASPPVQRDGDTPIHISKAPYGKVVQRGRPSKRTKKQNEELPTFYKPTIRRTKKDARQEMALMNAATAKIKSLTAENVQLQLRLQQAQQESAKLKLDLDQERRVTSECNAVNKALRQLLLEERTQTDFRSRLRVETVRPPPLSPSVMFPPQRESSLVAPDVALEIERVRRGGIANVEDLTDVLTDHYRFYQPTNRRTNSQS